MTVGSLFAGIGGFELAAQWAGVTPVWSNEIDPFCCKVLRKNFKHQIIEDDIRNIGAHNLQPVDIITGGFPCQPFSNAGKRKGTNDNRYLWPEMLRVIRELDPSYIVAENVLGLLTQEDGLVFDEICSEMESSGYEVQPLVLPAYTVGALHNRDRIWIVSSKRNPFNTYTNGSGLDKKRINEQRSIELQHEQIRLPGSLVSECIREGTDTRVFRDIDGIPDRVDRLGAIGNAIVPQVALQIFKSLKP